MITDPFSIGLLLDTVGKVLIGLTVLMVHRRISRERRIDKDVIGAMRKEMLSTAAGILLIIAGAAMQLAYYRSS